MLYIEHGRDWFLKEQEGDGLKMLGKAVRMGVFIES
jgi:hypothetical protein